MHSEEELKHLGDGYGDLILQDHPNGHHKGHKHGGHGEVSVKAEPQGAQDSGASDEVSGAGEDSSSDLEGKSEKELKHILMAQGVPAKDLKGKSKAELIALIEA